MLRLTAGLFIVMMSLSISTASELPSQTSQPQELNHWIIPASAAPPSDKLLRSLGVSPGSLHSVAQACCKVCRKGKACGDTCISRDKECHTPPGCACDG
jgi:hypothetical protein